MCFVFIFMELHWLLHFVQRGGISGAHSHAKYSISNLSLQSALLCISFWALFAKSRVHIAHTRAHARSRRAYVICYASNFTKLWGGDPMMARWSFPGCVSNTNWLKQTRWNKLHAHQGGRESSSHLSRHIFGAILSSLYAPKQHPWDKYRIIIKFPSITATHTHTHTYVYYIYPSGRVCERECMCTHAPLANINRNISHAPYARYPRPDVLRPGKLGRASAGNDSLSPRLGINFCLCCILDCNNGWLLILFLGELPPQSVENYTRSCRNTIWKNPIHV
jgi:hypothetical protein